MSLTAGELLTGARAPESTRALELVQLQGLMDATEGRREVIVGLIDGPVAAGLASLPVGEMRSTSGERAFVCTAPVSLACAHGTFIAAILSSLRGSTAPAICPGCTLLVRPVLPEDVPEMSSNPRTGPDELAAAILDCVAQGARVVNISLGVLGSSARGERVLTQAVDVAARRGVLLIAAAGNQGTVGGSALLGHPWVIPVAACDSDGAPLPLSNIGASIGRRGLLAPGDAVTSLLPLGVAMPASGTSVATPFVTGALALLSSLFPAATAGELRRAVLQVHHGRRAGVVPPRLDAERARRFLQQTTTTNR